MCASPRTQIKDLIGKKFGNLTVAAYDGKRKGSHYWLCRCDCGNEKVVSQSHLQNGHTKSCGCLRNIAGDLTGKVFGELTVVGPAEKRGGRKYWNCICSCGESTVVSQDNLINGHTKSCGHLAREVQSSNLKLVDGTSVVMLEKSKNRLVSSNTSGHTGVYKAHKRNMWTAQISFKGKTYYLGTFHNIEDAIKARKKGEEMHDAFIEGYYNSREESAADDSSNNTNND